MYGVVWNDGAGFGHSYSYLTFRRTGFTPGPLSCGDLSAMSRRNYIRIAALVTVPHWVLARAMPQPTKLGEARSKVYG